MKNILLISVFITNSVLSQTVSLEKVIDYNLDSEIESLVKVSESSSWRNVYPNALNIPKGFEKYELIHEIIDYDQVVYQSCNGEIWDRNRLTSMINRWGLDTVNCTPNFINSFINGIVGEYKGKLSYILDENNNLDFSDDKIFTIREELNNTHCIIFERYINSEIILDTVAIMVLSPKLNRNKEIEGLNYKYCEYRNGYVIIGDEKLNIALFPGPWYLYHKESRLVIDDQQEILNNYYFQASNNYYRISGIDKKGYELQLEKHPSKHKPNSCQIGFPAPDFKINDTLNLSDLKGKYVFLYFWNIDCGACEYGLPKYYKKYSDSKYSEIEIVLVSIAKPKESTEFLANHDIKWRNVQTVGNSEIYNNFGLIHFPTEYIIDPEGVIISNGNIVKIIEEIIK